jgi:6-phosphogluconolactonase
VLNSGGPGLDVPCGATMPNITGFKVKPNGQLSPISGSTQSIHPGPAYGGTTGENCSGVGPFATGNFQCGLNPPAFPRSPAQIGFTPEGDQLVVTVKGTNSIYVFPFSDRVPGTPTITQAPGATIPTYFGFGFDAAGHLIVSEPFGTATSIPSGFQGAASSFSIIPGGNLIPISVDVSNGRHLPCWIAIDPRTKRYAYTGNNGSSDISSYAIGDDGSLTLLNATAGTGASSPNDLAVAADKGAAFLYALNAETGTVGAWKINRDGSLTAIGADPVAGLPAAAGAQGLVAY